MTTEPSVDTVRVWIATRCLTVAVLCAVGLVGCANDGARGGAADTSPSQPPDTTTSEPVDGAGAEAAGRAVPSSSVGSTETATVASNAPATDGADVCPADQYPTYGSFDLVSGDLHWSTCSPEEAYRFMIGASDDVILAIESGGAASAQTVALDAASGAELWRHSTVRGLGTPPGPVVGQGITVVETDAEGTPFVMGVDATTGSERWRLDPGVSVVGLSDAVVVLAPSPTLGLPDPTAPPRGLRGVDRSTGEEVWTNNVTFRDDSGVGVARGAGSEADGLIVVPTGSTVTAVDASTGDVRWTAPQLDHPALSDGVVLGMEGSSGPNSQILSVDATSGETLWSAPGRESYGGLLAVGDGVGVVIESMTAAQLIAYDLSSGAERWRVDRTAPGEPQLTVDQSVVVLWEAHLGALSSVDGSTIWSLTMPLNSPLMNSVAANSRSVFVAVNSLPWGD